MINRSALLSDLRRVLRELEADLRSRCDELPEVAAVLRKEFEAAKEAQRTAESFEEWRSGYITQVAAAWVLSCVFVRFLEDNRLVEPPRISGPNERLRRARDEYDLYVHEHPTHTYRDYLLNVFDHIAELPGGKEIFGKHNPIHAQRGWLSGDAAGTLLTFFQKIEPTTGALVHDFGDDNWETRFLGDLYQDLSEEARDKYALLQTPEFVEEFILDRTLDPALAEFGIDSFRMIDPACGSGHFLLGSLARLLRRWSEREPGTKARVLVQRALDSVHGVDVNPYAAAIARFRLLLAALRCCGVTRLADAPAFHINVVCGDSLLHGTPNDQLVLGFDPLAHAYQSEDLPELRHILKAGRYHAVVANPPYITPKDRALNQAYRQRYSACHRQYSLSVPFMQRIFGLTVDGGYTGQITANSFMKREFGKKLIEQFLPTTDLTHVIDTSVACIPGHNTPTVILFGRNRRPVAQTLRAVMGIRGETITPTDPANGLAWSAICSQLEHPGSQSEFITVGDMRRELLSKHPWSIGGGGAAELKEQLDEQKADELIRHVDAIGRTVSTQGDDVYINPCRALRRNRVASECQRRIVSGDEVRDWMVLDGDHVVFPYDDRGEPVKGEWANSGLRFLWPTRTVLAGTFMFEGRTKVEVGMKWFEYGQWLPHRFRTPISIVYGEIASHNHFVLDKGGKVFNRTAPVIKLPPASTEEDHFALLGVLNSSIGCFWMKQITQPKTQTTGMDFETWQVRRAFNATKLHQFPLPAQYPQWRPRLLDNLARHRQALLPPNQFRSAVPCGDALTTSCAEAEETLGRMIAVQEELDWECYGLYGLIEESVSVPEPPHLKLGERAFEIVLARRIAAGETQTTWFERHRATPTTEIPSEWPESYRELVAHRIHLIESDVNVRLIEQPEYKRRWDTEPWESQVERGLREWLLDCLEGYFDLDGRMNERNTATAIFNVTLVSLARLADAAARDTAFMKVAELYRERNDFDVGRLVLELVEDESVPLLPVLRYKPVAIEKRRAWERTWQSQRQEDAIDARTRLATDHPDYLPESMTAQEKHRLVGEIPVPPKYNPGDYQNPVYWRLRGKLDVPKERWVSFPHCESEDGSPVVAWAGYDHLQLAQAVGTYYAEVKDKGGTQDPRLVPLLACLLELVPWLKQWHNEMDQTYQMRMGDYFLGYVEGEAKELGLTLQQIRDWTPPQQTTRRRRRQ